jgi:radical SAM-linked protein
MYQLKNSLPRKGANLRYHSPKLSYLEGVFSRGDRRLARLIETAWRSGARLDGWDEHFNLRRWQEAAKTCELNLDDYLRKRNIDEILPWQHLQTGVDLEFLKDELTKAKEEVYTPDCRYHACQKCGLCDFKSIQPIVCNRSGNVESNDSEEARADRSNQNHRLPADERSHFKYMVRYSRTGDICYLGHLEILQVVFRSLRRAEIVTHFSQGFNPSPKVSFGPALPVGTKSLDEFFIMDLPKPLKNPENTVQKLNDKLPPGLKIFAIELHSGRIAQNMLVSYTLTLNRPLTEQEKQISKDFIDSSHCLIAKTRKGKTKEIDIRPLIKTFEIIETHSITLTMVNAATQPGIKPAEAIKAILNLDNDTIMNIKILKTDWINMDAA